MVTNPKARELEEKGKVEYGWGTLWPHYHKEKINWAMGFRTKGDVDLLFLSGSTGRYPYEDQQVITYEDYRSGKGKVVGGIREQTRQALMDIKNNLETMGATLKHIVMLRFYVRHPEELYEFRNEMYRFWQEFEPELLEHPRPATLLNGVGIALPEMRIEIEAWAAVPKKGDW